MIASVWVEMMRRGVGRFHALIIAMLLSRLTLGMNRRKETRGEMKMDKKRRDDRETNRREEQ